MRLESKLLIIGIILISTTLILTQKTLNTEGKATDSLQSGFSKTTYVNAGKNLATIQDQTITYNINDRLGSQKINIQENNKKENTYGPYGENNKQDTSYTGKQKTNTGTTNLGAREYNTKTKRFTTPDPKLQDTTSTYNYAKNNPLANIDPDGKESADITRAIAIVVAGVTGASGLTDANVNLGQMHSSQVSGDGNIAFWGMEVEGTIGISDSTGINFKVDVESPTSGQTSLSDTIQPIRETYGLELTVGNENFALGYQHTSNHQQEDLTTRAQDIETTYDNGVSNAFFVKSGEFSLGVGQAFGSVPHGTNIPLIIPNENFNWNGFAQYTYERELGSIRDNPLTGSVTATSYANMKDFKDSFGIVSGSLGYRNLMITGAYNGDYAVAASYTINIGDIIN